MKKLEKPKVIGKAASSKREFQQLATSEAQELRHKKIPSRGSLRRKKMTDEEKWVKNGRTTVSAIADGGPETDLYLAHLNMILKQVTFRLNMYKLSGDFYDAKDYTKYQLPIQIASVVASLSQFSILFLPEANQRTVAALGAGGLGLFITAWNSFKISEKLNVKGQLFKGACSKYKDLARDVVRSIVKRKAKYHEYEGPPPLENLEDFVHFCREFNEKYQFMLELQQTLHFFPPMKLITMWLNSGVLTGEKPKRMRRRRRMPETGLPPEPGEGYEPVQEDDFNSDDEDWVYEDMPTPTQLKERKARRKAKRLKERKEKREKRRAARKLKREETLKKIRETAKAGVDASQDPEIMAKLEKRMQSAEIKMRAEDEAKEAAEDAADAAAHAEEEKVNAAANFIAEDECEPVEATTIEKSQEVVTTTKKRARRASEIVIAKVEHIEKTQKELIEEKRLAMERKHTQDINDANEEREFEYKKQEAAWIKAKHKEPYDGQNLEAQDAKIDRLKKRHAKFEKALNVLEHSMDHTDLLSDPLDDPLLLHTEMLNYDSGEEYGSTKEGNKTGRRVVSEEDFMLNARLLINKTYYRHNMYVASAHYVEARDQELYIPMIFLTAIATCTALAIASPLAELHPQKLALSSSIIGFVAMRLSAIRQTENYMGRAEVFRSAGGEYRLIATKLEQKLRTFRSLSPDSLERRDFIRASKPFFAEVSELIKNAQMAANIPMLEKQIVKWQMKNQLEADFIDQPEQPSRDLTMEEKNEASCLVNLGRAKAMKDILVKEMEATEAEDGEDVYGGPRDLEAGFKKVV